MRHNARPPFVPEGQTPFDDSLNHPLLDVIKEGEKARETGNGSPYHGHSLEHCLHATGWVCRDLRIALDAAQAEIARLREALECLIDEQNGPPIERHAHSWQMAMDRARAALAVPFQSINKTLGIGPEAKK